MALQTWAENLLSLSLSAGGDRLIHTPMLRERVEGCESFAVRYLSKVTAVATQGFEENDAAAKAEAHRALFALYELQLCRPDDEAAPNQHDPLLYSVRNLLERAWLAAERAALVPCAAESPARTVNTIARLCKAHDASSHRLFDYLAVQADRIAMQRFFASDSALNIRFFDLLALSMVGSEEFTRPELVQNLWDESGRGNRNEAHVHTFRDLLDTCGLTQMRFNQIGALPWQGYAGHNLFMMTALSREHYWKLLGVMAVTELIDPASYEKVVHGCRRLGFAGDAYRYYSEHVEIDVVHGQGWLQNVIVPLIERTPAAAADVVFGAQLRLASCEQYYDCLLSLLEQTQYSMA
ncbi:iron-containing redox enzyme family protein [Trinickia dinghuensis]|uniref:Iron-containing redox enzyme family protein n=1 Tax=Trinickia dinghuensis TaxID=2291023 RepID=A0A3D8JNZ4_9BURK|nr:iron-containing redox enzyme family protein [Trinickia dinghuensis]RDU94532.1 iron-containing redox enzyme family protein [Trinickia dinghuensis]